MRDTKPCRRIGYQCCYGEEVLTSHPPSSRILWDPGVEGVTSQSWGDLSREDTPETRESRMVAVAASFIIVDRCLRVSQVAPGWPRGEWV
jgi:hypothetical protein